MIKIDIESHKYFRMEGLHVVTFTDKYPPFGEKQGNYGEKRKNGMNKCPRSVRHINS
jgi:hypothetical protein